MSKDTGARVVGCAGRGGASRTFGDGAGIPTRGMVGSRAGLSAPLGRGGGRIARVGGGGGFGARADSGGDAAAFAGLGPGTGGELGRTLRCGSVCTGLGPGTGGWFGDTLGRGTDLTAVTLGRGTRRTDCAPGSGLSGDAIGHGLGADTWGTPGGGGTTALACLGGRGGTDGTGKADRRFGVSERLGRL